MTDVTLKLVKSQDELEACFAIRKSVFVQEQHIFEGSDQDHYDREAIHIIALNSGKVVGTVRMYQKGRGLWFGSRLAISKGFRSGHAGSMLVKRAVEIVKERGARKFLAWIQVQNVRFFARLGWRPLGRAIPYHGLPHQLMEAELNIEQ